MKIIEVNYNDIDGVEVLNLKQLKEFIHIEINTAYNLMNSPAFPSYKIDLKNYRVNAADLIAWVELNKNRNYVL